MVENATNNDLTEDDFAELEEDAPKELAPWERPFDVQPNGSAAGLDLSGKELDGDLSGIDFRKAILGGWDPVEEGVMYGPGGTPDLQYTEFTDANLDRASFAGRDLSHLIFDRVTLRGADLSGCTLFCTVFREVDFTGANLTGVKCAYDAYISDSKLDGVLGLEGEELKFLLELN